MIPLRLAAALAGALVISLAAPAGAGPRLVERARASGAVRDGDLEILLANELGGVPLRELGDAYGVTVSRACQRAARARAQLGELARTGTIRAPRVRRPRAQ